MNKLNDNIPIRTLIEEFEIKLFLKDKSERNIFVVILQIIAKL